VLFVQLPIHTHALLTQPLLHIYTHTHTHLTSHISHSLCCTSTHTQAALKAAVAHQPVSVAIEADQQAFQVCEWACCEVARWAGMLDCLVYVSTLTQFSNCKSGSRNPALLDPCFVCVWMGGWVGGCGCGCVWGGGMCVSQHIKQYTLCSISAATHRQQRHYTLFRVLHDVRCVSCRLTRAACPSVTCVLWHLARPRLA